jgi:hypothetical protein
LGRGLLNPNCFSSQFRRYPWFPFEDFYFSQRQIEILLQVAREEGGMFRSEMPCRDALPQTYYIDNPDKADEARVSEWLAHYEGIIWIKSGILIINSFSDYVILAMSDDVSFKMFGQSLYDIYMESETTFKADLKDDPILNDFMNALQETWETRDSN